MARIKLRLPEKFLFSTSIPVRITDLNYGGHVGNDSVLSIIHEIRVRLLRHKGYGELDFAGVGLIMTDVTIEFKKELFYGDVIEAEAAFSDISNIGFDIIYHLFTRKNESQKTTVAIARSGMVCYDYEKKKVVAIPKEALKKVQSTKY